MAIWTRSTKAWVFHHHTGLEPPWGSDLQNLRSMMINVIVYSTRNVLYTYPNTYLCIIFKCMYIYIYYAIYHPVPQPNYLPQQNSSSWCWKHSDKAFNSSRQKPSLRRYLTLSRTGEQRENENRFVRSERHNAEKHVKSLFDNNC